MIRFDYLHDAPWGVVDAVRTARIPRRFHDVTAALVAVAVLCLVASGIERTRIADARRARESAQIRFDRSRAALERLRVQSQQLEALLAQDRQLRAVRLSGPLTARRIALLGNVVPPDVTLDSMQATPSGYDVKGHAATLRAFGVLLTHVQGTAEVPRPVMLRVSKDAGILAGLSFDLATASAP